MRHDTTQQTLNKGDIVYVSGGDAVGCEIWSNRYAVIVSCDAGNLNSGVVTIVYLSTAKNNKRKPTHTPVMSKGVEATAMCEQVFTVDKSRVHKESSIYKVKDEELKMIDQCISLALNITPSKLNMESVFKKWENYEKLSMKQKLENSSEVSDSSSKTQDIIINALTRRVNELEDELRECKGR